MSFTEDMRRFAEKAKRGYVEVTTESLIDLSASIIIKTPVDEGTLANNWQASTDTPAPGTIVLGGGSGQKAKIKRSVAASIGGLYYFVNNLPYAGRIEFDGHSDKAPAGMVRVSIENYQKFLDNAISQLDN